MWVSGLLAFELTGAASLAREGLQLLSYVATEGGLVAPVGDGNDVIFVVPLQPEDSDAGSGAAQGAAHDASASVFPYRARELTIVERAPCGRPGFAPDAVVTAAPGARLSGTLSGGSKARVARRLCPGEDIAALSTRAPATVCAFNEAIAVLACAVLREDAAKAAAVDLATRIIELSALGEAASAYSLQVGPVRMLPPRSGAALADGVPSLQTLHAATINVGSTGFDLRTAAPPIDLTYCVNRDALPASSAADRLSRSTIGPVLAILRAAATPPMVQDNQRSVASLLLTFLQKLLEHPAPPILPGGPSTQQQQQGSIFALRGQRRAGWAIEMLSLEGVEALCATLALGARAGAAQRASVVFRCPLGSCDRFFIDSKGRLARHRTVSTPSAPPASDTPAAAKTVLKYRRVFTGGIRVRKMPSFDSPSIGLIGWPDASIWYRGGTGPFAHDVIVAGTRVENGWIKLDAATIALAATNVQHAEGETTRNFNALEHGWVAITFTDGSTLFEPDPHAVSSPGLLPPGSLFDRIDEVVEFRVVLVKGDACANIGGCRAGGAGGGASATGGASSGVSPRERKTGGATGGGAAKDSSAAKESPTKQRLDKLTLVSRSPDGTEVVIDLPADESVRSRALCAVAGLAGSATDVVLTGFPPDATEAATIATAKRIAAAKDPSAQRYSSTDAAISAAAAAIIETIANDRTLVASVSGWGLWAARFRDASIPRDVTLRARTALSTLWSLADSAGVMGASTLAALWVATTAPVEAIRGTPARALRDAIVSEGSVRKLALGPWAALPFAPRQLHEAPEYEPTTGQGREHMLAPTSLREEGDGYVVGETAAPADDSDDDEDPWASQSGAGDSSDDDADAVFRVDGSAHVALSGAGGSPRAASGVTNSYGGYTGPMNMGTAFAMAMARASGAPPSGTSREAVNGPLHEDVVDAPFAMAMARASGAPPSGTSREAVNGPLSDEDAFEAAITASLAPSMRAHCHDHFCIGCGARACRLAAGPRAGFFEPAALGVGGAAGTSASEAGKRSSPRALARAVARNPALHVPSGILRRAALRVEALYERERAEAAAAEEAAEKEAREAAEKLALIAGAAGASTAQGAASGPTSGAVVSGTAGSAGRNAAPLSRAPVAHSGHAASPSRSAAIASAMRPVRPSSSPADRVDRRTARENIDVDVGALVRFRVSNTRAPEIAPLFPEVRALGAAGGGGGAISAPRFASDAPAGGASAPVGGAGAVPAAAQPSDAIRDALHALRDALLAPSAAAGITDGVPVTGRAGAATVSAVENGAATMLGGAGAATGGGIEIGAALVTTAPATPLTSTPAAATLDAPQIPASQASPTSPLTSGAAASGVALPAPFAPPSAAVLPTALRVSVIARATTAFHFFVPEAGVSDAVARATDGAVGRVIKVDRRRTLRGEVQVEVAEHGKPRRVSWYTARDLIPVAPSPPATNNVCSGDGCATGCRNCRLIDLHGRVFRRTAHCAEPLALTLRADNNTRDGGNVECSVCRMTVADVETFLRSIGPSRLLPSSALSSVLFSFSSVAAAAGAQQFHMCARCAIVEDSSADARLWVAAADGSGGAGGAVVGSGAGAGALGAFGAVAFGGAAPRSAVFRLPAVQVSQHPHLLHRIAGGWRNTRAARMNCSACRADLASAWSRTAPGAGASNTTSWHCLACEYRVCATCAVAAARTVRD
jgi:hypothetical protein